jgi:hypothetical protein
VVLVAVLEVLVPLAGLLEEVYLVVEAVLVEALLLLVIQVELLVEVFLVEQVGELPLLMGLGELLVVQM